MGPAAAERCDSATADSNKAHQPNHNQHNRNERNGDLGIRVAAEKIETVNLSSIRMYKNSKYRTIEILKRESLSLNPRK